MITRLEDAVLGGRLAMLQAAVKAGVPATQIFAFEVDATETPGRSPMQTAPDVEHDLEAALAGEWSVLSAPLDGDLETQIINLLDGSGAVFTLVRCESGDSLGTRLACGRFAAVEAARDACASVRFSAAMGATGTGVTIAAIPGDPTGLRLGSTSGSGLQSHPGPEIGPDSGSSVIDPWVRRLEREWSLQTSLWLAESGRAILIDAGGPPVDLADPWDLAAMETDAAGKLAAHPAVPVRVLQARAHFGRVFNRVIRPEDPFEWIPLLLEWSSGSDLEESFVSACAAVEPGSGERLISLARRSVAAERSQERSQAESPADSRAGSQASTRSEPRRRPAPGTRAPAREPTERPGVQQLAGRAGTGGEASGPVTHRRAAGANGHVRVCDRFGPADEDLAGNAAAIVERHGSRFSPGALFALERGIPHVCGLTDTDLLEEGAMVVVNGDLGLVTRIRTR